MENTDQRGTGLENGSEWSNGTVHFDPTCPTWKSGPPQKVNRFFRNFSGWPKLVHSVLDRNFRKFWLNGSHPCSPVKTIGLQASEAQCTNHVLLGFFIAFFSVNEHEHKPNWLMLVLYPAFCGRQQCNQFIHIFTLLSVLSGKTPHDFGIPITCL